MADEADMAQERTEVITAAALANRKPEGPRATGYCLECGDFLRPYDCSGCGDGAPIISQYHGGVVIKVHRYPGGVVGHCFAERSQRRWCNAECRDMWESRNG